MAPRSSIHGRLAIASGALMLAAVEAVLPHTCANGSVAYELPFCNPTLPLSDRVSDLLGRFTLEQKVQQFSIPASEFQFQPDLNLKQFLWDITCMRGIAPNAIEPNRNVTVYPHAIALAATWDLDLYTRIGQATALEGRIINQLNYEASNGTSWQGVNCDGGPLANSQHDPRWGRVSETYGEDPFLIAMMGVTATQALQAQSADGRWLGTAQVTRHYLGYHDANDLPHGGEEFIDLFSFTEQQELPYRSFQIQGGAEGLMCAISAFAIGDRGDWNTSLAPLVPSCVHPFLWAKLQQWGVRSYVQGDCCDSITEMVTQHHYYPDVATAVVGAVQMGLDASYGPNSQISAALTALLQNGSIDEGLLDMRLSRTLETRFKLGEFDIGRNPDYPFAGPFNVSKLDGPEHRQLAREATASSIVLLQRNNASLLPLQLKPGQTLAIIGPFADCGLTTGGYGIPVSDDPVVCSSLHSYAGWASNVSTVLSAAREEAAAGGYKVVYVQGSNIITAQEGGIAAAVTAATNADAVLLIVGLSGLIEAEGVDRHNLTLPQAQQDLVAGVGAVAGSKTALVMVSGGGADTTYSFFGAALQAWYGGEEMGHGLMDVLSGRVNPSGKLPLTIYRNEYVSIIEPLAVFTMVTSQGTGRTYRFLNESASGSGPGSLVHYWFGHGLSYTEFTFSALSVSLSTPLPGPGANDLTMMAAVNLTVTNTGGVAGAEVAQVYVSVPTDGAAVNATGGAPIPKYSLFAFQKTRLLQPGEAQALQLQLPLRAFQSTTRSGHRLVTGGSYVVSVGGRLPDDTSTPSTCNVVTASVQLPALHQE